MSEGFFLDARTALVCFRAFRMFHIDTLPDRVAFMRKVVAKGQAQYIRDAQQFLKGKNVIGFKAKDNS